MGGVIIGTAAVITLVSLAAGSEKKITEQMQTSFGDVNQIVIFGPDSGMMGGPSPTEEESSKQKAPDLDEDFVKKLEKMDGFEAVMPIRNLGSIDLKYKKRSGNGQFQAVDPKYFKKYKLKIAQGSSLGNGKKIVIGYQVAKQLFGKKFKLPNKKFQATFAGSNGPESGSQKATKLKIAGVLKSKGGENDYTVYISEKKGKSLARIFGLNFNKKKYEQIFLKADSPESAEKLNNELKKMNLFTMSMQDMIKGMKKVFLILYALLGGIGAIALVVAALGITNTMTMAIYERTKEIGIFKALGTSNRKVMQLFIMEAAAIGFLGGIFGVFLGFMASKVINLIIAYTQNMKIASAQILYTPVWLMVFGVAFATVIALLAGIFPAARAARLSPLNALRHE